MCFLGVRHCARFRDVLVNKTDTVPPFLVLLQGSSKKGGINWIILITIHVSVSVLCSVIQNFLSPWPFSRWWKLPYLSLATWISSLLRIQVQEKKQQACSLSKLHKSASSSLVSFLKTLVLPWADFPYPRVSSAISEG